MPIDHATTIQYILRCAMCISGSSHLACQKVTVCRNSLCSGRKITLFGMEVHFIQDGNNFFFVKINFGQDRK
jgi:hypothetical protein